MPNNELPLSPGFRGTFTSDNAISKTVKMFARHIADILTGLVLGEGGKCSLEDEPKKCEGF
jgi:hypothetical protein